MRILFVDDKDDYIDLFKTAVKDWNKANPQRTFDPVVLNNADDAFEALKLQRFDCALLDLKFQNGNPGQQLAGNQLALTGLNEIGMPVGILSGNPEDRSEELKKQPLARAFVKKAEACDAALAWFGELWDMMEVLSAARKNIRKSGAEIFAGRIWPRWKNYKDLSAVGIPLERIITRQYAAHIAELMGIDGKDNPDWHPQENYIFPALLDHRAHTGDLFRLEDGQIWVVLTPQCDMANRSVDDVLLAHCNPDLVAGWDEKLKLLNEALATTEGPSNNLSGWFRDRVNQKLDASVHFLPPLEDRPMMVNFKKLRLVPLADLTGKLDTDRVASVAPAFLANLTQRFAAYMARPGQPNIGVKHFGAAKVLAPAK